MHSPSYFLGLLAAACSMNSIAQAGPVQKRNTLALPPFFQPPSVPLPLPAVAPAAFAALERVDLEQATSTAAHQLAAGLKINASDVIVSNSHFADGINHVYFTQAFNGLPIANAVSNANLDAFGNVISIYQSFAPAQMIESATAKFVQKRDQPTISIKQAIQAFAEVKGFSTSDKLVVTEKAKNEFSVSGASFVKFGDIRGSQKYYQTQAGLVLVWDLVIKTNPVWTNVFVNAETGEIVAASNWTLDYVEDVSIAHAVLARRRVNTVQETKKSLVARAVDAVYNVIPIGKSDPQNGGFAQVRTQGDKTASPNGWHNFKGVQRTDLAGNNVLAQSNEKGAFESARTLDDVIRMARPTRPDLNFNYAAASADAATTNMFYVANTMHDVFYNYGFTEAAGNFQFSNNGKGGKEDDGVIALSQDAEGKNNAWFAADVDGRAGIMKMFFFDVSGQTRDGALQNDIVIHEMGHGLSIRLTGGPSAGNCLQNGASGGLGEGWSDFFGYVMSLPAGSTRDTDYLMGNWAAPKSRPPLSTNLQRDNRKYSQIPTMLFKNPQTGQQEMEPHAVGGVWATILYEVMWNMIDISGRTAADQIVTAKNSGTGNTALINIIISAMKIQPCNPTFITARDAILQAEAQLYQGKYRCAIWSPFSKRGLGSNAREGYQDNFDLPADCINGGNPKPTTTTAPATTTTKPSTGGNLEGKPCSAPGSSQCSNAVTYLCWYSASGSYTWTKWYDGGCPAGPIDPAPTTTTTTTTNPSSGGLAGQACAIFGSSQCSKGVTYQCQYSGFNLVWAKWYDGGC